ncbi:MAG: HAD family phosphatase [Clostridia bacterium]|nr:HAD family phosphatase [Clostridia bacterium]
MSKFEGVFILTDMDGTLLDSSASIAPRDAAAIDYFIENGGCFSVATGRARGSVERFLPDLHTSAPSIVDNGAWISDLRTGETLRLAAMGSEAADMVEDMIDRFPMVGVEICLPGIQYVVNHNMYTERHHKNIGLELHRRALHEVAHPWVKINLLEDHEVLCDAMEYLIRRYKDRFFAQFSLPHIYEITQKGFSKGDSALWLRDHLGVLPENFYTVGDGTNDLELLAVAGDNSYAPRNAKAIILEAAHHHLPDNDSGAIAALIELLDKKY